MVEFEAGERQVVRFADGGRARRFPAGLYRIEIAKLTSDSNGMAVALFTYEVQSAA
jgi:hypothetical protein